VETALVLPVLLLLLLIAVDFGRLFTTYVAINNAAREGAFYAAEHAKDTPWDQFAFDAGVDAAAQREVNVQGQGGEGALTVDPPVCHVAGSPASTLDCDVAATSTSAVGNQVTVSVSQPFSLVTPVVGELFGGSLDLRASATAPVLNPASVTVLPGEETPTPSPSPTASPSPSASSSTPGGSPTPTPSPTPVPTCTVPNLLGQFYNTDPNAQDGWALASFTGPLINESENKAIQSQSLVPGTVVLCTDSMRVSNGKNLAFKG
jgi:Flp pilus assembly protein TadG